MGSAAKKKIGFVTGKEENKTFSRKDTMKEGPIMNLLRIRIPQFQLKAISKSKFVKLMIRSKDGKMAIDMILKDSNSSLELVPRSMPSISISMEKSELLESVNRKTLVMLEDGQRNKGYALVGLSEVELLDSKWTYKKRMKS
jgi:hypothetical protein